MKIAVNATPLIHAVKCGLHKIIERLDLEIITTSEVLEEVLKPNFPEYLELQNFIGKNVKVANTAILIEFNNRDLDIGEASVLSLAKKENIVLITDDKLAVAYGVANNVEVLYTTSFIFKALENQIIAKNQALGYLDKLVATGWRCDIGTYIKIKNKIEGYK